MCACASVCACVCTPPPRTQTDSGPRSRAGARPTLPGAHSRWDQSAPPLPSAHRAGILTQSARRRGQCELLGRGHQGLPRTRCGSWLAALVSLGASSCASTRVMRAPRGARPREDTCVLCSLYVSAEGCQHVCVLCGAGGASVGIDQQCALCVMFVRTRVAAL